MKDAPMSPPGPAQLARPREAISQFVGEVCRDLESQRVRLGAVDSVDQLIIAVTDTHKTLVEHGRTMGQFLQFVHNWRQDSP